MNTTKRMLAGAGAAIGAAALVTVPLTAAAQDDDGDDGPRDGWVGDALDDLVEDGTVTQGQADAVEDALEGARPERERVRPGPGFGHRRGGAFGGERLTTVAEALGLEESALLDALRDGQTIADIAEAQGVDVQDVIDALVADATERITTFVNEGFPARGEERAADEDSATDTPATTAPPTTQGD
jgi:hypothetical protein